MIGPFQELDQLFDIIEALSRRRLQVPGFNFEGLPGRLLHRQPEAQEMINDLLERISRPPQLFLQQLGNIVVQSESGSHILMLNCKHHDVNTRVEIW